MDLNVFSTRKDLIDLSTVSPEVLYQKRQTWVTPGSRIQPIRHTNIHVKDFSQNNANFYGVTPPASNPAPQSGGFSNNKAKFYGITPPASGQVTEKEFNKNQAKFFGITPPQSSAARNMIANQVSRPVSNNTEYQLNMQKFYLSTPSDELQYRKNAKAFYHRSPLASAGKNVIQ